MKCYICGLETDTQVHHVYEGRNRKISDKQGFVVDLCFGCHRYLHDEKEQTLNKWLKQNIQKKYEEFNTRESFMQLIGRNYIEE